MNSNLIIYASAASGGAALLGIGAFFLYRQRRNKRQEALLIVVAPTNFQSIGLRQLSGNPYPGGRHASALAPNSGLMYKPADGMKTTVAPQFGKVKSGPSFGLGGFHPEQGSGFGNTSATAQFIQSPNLQNLLLVNHPPPFVGTMNASDTYGTQTSSLYGITTTEQPRNYGNTITVVPKSTLHFGTSDMTDAQ